MADITYIAKDAGLLYLAVVLEAWSRPGRRLGEGRHGYNPHRRHSALDYLSPMAYKQRDLVPA